MNVSKNNINENYVYGIVYGSSNNVTIENNNISNNDYYGIYVTNSTNNNINNNNILNSGSGGIWLSSQFGVNTNNKITSNNISNSALSGILLQGSYNTLIINNKLNNNYYGVYVTDGSNDIINIKKIIVLLITCMVSYLEMLLMFQEIKLLIIVIVEFIYGISQVILT